MPGKRRKAKAYAASTEVVTCATVVSDDWMRLLRRYRPRWPASKAFENAEKEISLGIRIPGQVSRDDAGWMATTTAL